jgi:HTH-type transcriptional regulator/antitoxin HigA
MLTFNAISETMGFPKRPVRRATGGSFCGQSRNIMIKSDAQRDRTVAQIEGFKKALAKAADDGPGKRSPIVRGNYQSIIVQLEDELHEFEQLKSGKLNLPRVKRLVQIAPLITKIRIAKGVSQTELARRLRVSKQVVSRYEENEYQTVAITRLQEILDAIGVRIALTLRP